MKAGYKTLLSGIITVAALLVSVMPGFAQSTSPLTASVDRDSIALGETINLKISISGNSLKAPSPEMPSLDGFQTLSTGNSSQISLINGSMTVVNTYTYRLQPTRSGDIIINAIHVTIGGQTYETQPITIHVSDQSSNIPDDQQQDAHSQNGPKELIGQDYFVKAEVDKKTPYMGEQITYTFSFYHAVELYDQPFYASPPFTGFWSESQSNSNSYQTVISNRMYNVSELKSILFPTTSGRLTIDPARLTIPASIFNAENKLQTEPIEIDVKALPDGAPEGFNGAVGQFSISQEVDTNQGKVNEPLTQKVILQGNGNLNNLPDPLWQDIDGWRIFDSQANTASQVNNGMISGTRTYERLLVPSKEGQFTIPPVEYIFFDPASAQYQTIATEGIDVSVAAAAMDTAPVTNGNHKETVEQIGSDIRYLKDASNAYHGASPDISKYPFFWLAFLLPLGILTGNFLWQRRQVSLQNNLSLVRSSKARRKARKAISEALKSGSDPYSASNQILLTYLSDKTNKPVGGLTHDALATLLSSKGLTPELIQSAQNLLVTGDMGRYAPGNTAEQADSLLEQLSTLIDRLEKNLS